MLLNQLSRALYEIRSTQKTNIYIYIYTKGIDLIHDTNRIFKKLVQRWNRIDGIKVMACGIPGGKKRLKFANTSNRGLICLFSLNDTTDFQNV